MPYLILQLFPRAPINLHLPFEGRCQGSKLVVYRCIYIYHAQNRCSRPWFSTKATMGTCKRKLKEVPQYVQGFPF